MRNSNFSFRVNFLMAKIAVIRFIKTLVLKPVYFEYFVVQNDGGILQGAKKEYFSIAEYEKYVNTIKGYTVSADYNILTKSEYNNKLKKVK